MDWTYSGAAVDVDPMWGELHSDCWERLGTVGTWWTGPERVEILAEVRRARSSPACRELREAISPNAVTPPPNESDVLSDDVVNAIRRIACDPGRLTRTWFDELSTTLAEEPYVELVAIVCTQFAIDGFARAIGVDEAPLPTAGDGEPSRERPDGVGDVGAWVSQDMDKALANVSRAVSLVPGTGAVWRDVVQGHYSRGPQFMELTWDRALTRPQVEVVAATVSSLNECFY